MAPEQMPRFGQFYEAARHNEALDERTTMLLHLAAAMALGGVVLLRPGRAQHPDTGCLGRRHINHMFPGGHKLLANR